MMSSCMTKLEFLPEPLLAQKYGDAPDTLQARMIQRSTWLQHRTSRSCESQRHASQFDLQLTRRESFISNFRWNMLALPR